MFFIDNDDAEVGHGSEHRGTCAEHNPGPAAERLPPSQQALVIRQRRMQHGHGHAEPFSKASYQLWGQANFGYQYEGASSLCQHALDELQIHLGLAASGHSVKYKGAVVIE